MQNGRGAALQCEQRTQLADGSSARSGPLKTMATMARLQLSSKINGLGIQGGPFPRIPEKQVRRRNRSRDKKSCLGCGSGCGHAACVT